MLLIGLAWSPAQAVETRIEVRVISQGAKFIGTSMGGVRVILRDADTGELLATGTTQGSTGDTNRIMRQQHPRNRQLATESAAVFATRLDLNEPRRIEVTATGPLAQPQSMNTVSASQWIVPGKHLSGDNGWLLEMPGFVVDILDPPAHHSISGLPAEVPLQVNVSLMCGCPVTPGGLWDADSYEINALIKRNGAYTAEVPLNYAGTTSQFTGTLSLEQPGSYEVTVYAYDPATGNTGIDKTTFNLSPDS